MNTLRGTRREPKESDIVSQKNTHRQTATNLYKKYRSMVFWVANSLLKNAQDAEDLTQDIFLGLLRNNTFNPERGSIAHFLHTLTRCRAIDRLRTKEVKRRAQVRLGAIHPAAIASPLENAITLERAEELSRALPHLPVKQRHVLELAYYGGLSQTQIAVQLNLPLGTVKSRIYNAQGVLRVHLAIC
jgi:RNA polymerase sigma-70 factor, ECF subfamily